MILVGSVLIHLVLLGAMVLAERRSPSSAETASIDVELVPQAELPEPPKLEKPEPPKPPEQKSEPQKKAEASAPPAAPAAKQEQSQPPDKPQKPQQSSETPAKEPVSEKPEKPEKPSGPSGGAPSESKSKLTPEEIAALRAQVQKCWVLPVGIPGMLSLEAVIRVRFGPKGQLVGAPELLKASASERGPILVGIAMNALDKCAPFKLPAAKYSDWKVLDLRFLATGMTGLGAVKQPKGS